MDGSHSNGLYSQTYQDTPSWWSVNLNNTYELSGIKIWSSTTPYSPTKYYIFFSELPINFNEIPLLISNPWINYVHVVDGLQDGELIPLLGVNGTSDDPIRANHIKIIKVGNGPLSISEIGVWGDVFDPFLENCYDDIDNDFDGDVDCEDSSCGTKINNVSYTNPSCEVCKDGEICIQDWGASHISLDGGQTWIPVSPYSITCVPDLADGDYSIMIKRESTGCSATYPDLIELRPPIGQPTAHCHNGGLEYGNFDNWDLEVGFIIDGNMDVDFEEALAFWTHYRILASGTAQYGNSLVGTPIIGLPTEGLFFMELLTPNQFVARTNRVTYCFDVTEENSDFHFSWAAVVENGDTDPGSDKDHDGVHAFYRHFIYEVGGPIGIIPIKNFRLDADDFIFKFME